MDSNDSKDSQAPNEEFRVVSQEFKEMQRKYADPVFIGSMLSRVAEEKSSFNLVLREINAKLDRIIELEERISRIESKIASQPQVPTPAPAAPGQAPDAERNFLSEVDGGILKFVERKGFCTAEEVQRKFSYNGANGASARLNSLFKAGLLDKKQAGKKVVFFPKSGNSS